MTKLDVSRVDGVFCIVGRDGVPSPVRLGGRPVRAFQTGWQPRGASDGWAPWTVLDLVHESGREASWLLDRDMDHRAGAIAQLPAADRAAVAHAAAAPLASIHREMLCNPQPVRPEALARFVGLNRVTIDEIVQLAGSPVPDPVLDPVLAETQTVSLHGNPQGPAGTKARAWSGRPIRLRAVQACLAGNFQQALQDALRDGFLSCPSPVDAQLLRSRDSLVLDQQRIAYRFVDPRSGLVFFVSSTSDSFSKADLFVPSINSVFSLHADPEPLGGLARMFLAHVIIEADALLAYLATPGRRFAVALRGYPDVHVGRQLGQELTALDRLARQLEAPLLPEVIIPAADQGTEAFAPVERILPQFEGRVDRALRHPAMLGDFTYRTNTCLFRALDEHVTLALGRRIRDAAAHEPGPASDQRLAARIKAERLPCVLFGVRTHNRTAIDPAAVIIDSIEHLSHRLGRIVVVIDGHNARLNQDPVSHYPDEGQGLHEPPVFSELRLALQLQRRFEGSTAEIVNLCGSPVARSLFWAERANFFVAFWGSGLAKYRWACNRPGLVLTNLWNLQHRADLDRYHAPRYQEEGAPIRFVPASAVMDVPEAPVLFAPTNPIPGYSNFQVDLGALRHALNFMITEHLA